MKQTIVEGERVVILTLFKKIQLNERREQNGAGFDFSRLLKILNIGVDQDSLVGSS